MKKANQTQIIINQNLNLPLTLNQDLKKNLSQLKTDLPEIRIVYFGTPEFSAYILEELINFANTQPALSHPRGVTFSQPKFTIQTVVTRADKPVGRHQTISQSPVSLVAQKYNIPVLKPLNLNEEFIQSHLSFLESDLFVVASYGKIIPQALLDIPNLGAINVHGSILPEYRGTSPIQSAILSGEKTTGVTIMLMDAQIDHGQILSTKEISILDQDNFQTLSRKMSQVGSKLLIETLTKFVAGKVTPKQQNHAQATFCSLLKKDSGYFDISAPLSVQILDRMIRAYHPWPGVWTHWSFGSAQDKNNKIVKFYPQGKIQMEGKKVMDLKDFLNGYPDFPIKSIILTE